MDNKSNYQFLVVQASIDAIKQDTDDKIKKHYSNFTEISKIIKQLMVQDNYSLPDKVDSPKSHGLDTMVLDKNKAPPLEDGYSMQSGGMWNLKHDISSPNLYKLLINK